MILSRLILGAVLASIICGCGTMANLDGRTFPLMGRREERPGAFGGVRRDIGWVSSLAVPFNLLFAVDVPVSFVADVVTLPQVRYEQVRWDAKQVADAKPVKVAGHDTDGASESN